MCYIYVGQLSGQHTANIQTRHTDISLRVWILHPDLRQQHQHQNKGLLSSGSTPSNSDDDGDEKPINPPEGCSTAEHHLRLTPDDPVQSHDSGAPLDWQQSSLQAEGGGETRSSHSISTNNLPGCFQRPAGWEQISPAVAKNISKTAEQQHGEDKKHKKSTNIYTFIYSKASCRHVLRTEVI